MYRKVEQREAGAPKANRLVSIPTSEQGEKIKSESNDMSVFPRCKLYTNGENNTGPSPSSPPSALPRLSSSSSSS